MKRGDAFERTKRRLSERYLGIAGIHGIGLLRADRLLRVYCVPGKSAYRQSILEQLKRDAEPLKVEVISKPPPRIG